ncbi:M23 family metallopeptidase [Streptomyces sp. NPDC002055]|uniref:M23 family metallopeptidase n=1 Tax=Streptomyces sp. NPDC002055 TaxID=3154534 RepID=UPI00331B8A70
MSTEDQHRAPHPPPPSPLVRHLICGSLLGALCIVPTSGTAWAATEHPASAHRPGADRVAYAAGTGRDDAEPGDDDPQEAQSEQSEQVVEELAEASEASEEAAQESQWQVDTGEDDLRGWVRPVAVGAVSAEYGIPGEWIAGHHTGVDLAVPVGTSVHSVGTGVVTQADWAGDYGLMVMVKLDDGHYVLYAHLSEVAVHEGQRVEAGTLLGQSGNTGNSTGPHLHFEVRTSTAYGSDLDPAAYLEAKGILL